jgi:outer membrane lipoprotein-sorting protein
MRHIIFLVSGVLVLFAVLFFAAGDTQSEQAARIVRKIDELYRSSTSRAVFEMDIVTPQWQRTLKIQAWSSGMKKTFMRILEPKKERGMATLRLGNEMWNYLPNTNKIIKIPPSLMMGSWMGSDFTNDDLVKEFTFIDDYTFDMTTVDQPQTGQLYVKCVPKPDVPIVWGYVILAVRAGDYMPVWEKYYNEKGELVREMQFKEIRRFGAREIPAVMELIPTTKQGHKTVVRYVEAEFDIPLSGEIFSLRNLRAAM